MSFDITQTMKVEDDRLIVRRSQDNLDHFLDENKALASEGAKSVGPAGFRLVGRIPMVVMEQWMRECGAALGSKELQAYVKRKLMSGEFSRLNVHGF